jgi:hypothetical protein
MLSLHTKGLTQKEIAEKLDIQVNGDVIVLNFRILLSEPNLNIDGYKTYNLFRDLLNIIGINEKITQEDNIAIKLLLKKEKESFSKWRNENMRLSDYVKFINSKDVDKFKSLINNTDPSSRKEQLEQFIKKNEVIDKKIN